MTGENDGLQSRELPLWPNIIRVLKLDLISSLIIDGFKGTLIRPEFNEHAPILRGIFGG